jgi:C_GCAxxG_C_C family probable redox protein
MSNKDYAIALFKQHFNCAQSVFTAYRQEDLLDETAALKLATIFGAGVACSGNHLCGAVSGALMAISMKYGRGSIEDTESKAITYELGRKFMAEFDAVYGSCICDQILGINISDPENMHLAEEQNLFQTKCLEFVKTAADILDNLL